MKLFLLKKIKGLDYESNPWRDTWDCIHKMLICADDEDEARKMATERGEHETVDFEDAWLNPNYSTCKELKPSKKRIIIMDFRQG